MNTKKYEEEKCHKNCSLIGFVQESVGKERVKIFWVDYIYLD